MTKFYINVAGKWGVVAAYDIEPQDLDEVRAWVESLGCDPRETEDACRAATGINTGVTISNPDLRMSLVLIGGASSPEQWWDTVVHELKHVQSHISACYNVDGDSEEAAYLIGYLMRIFLRKNLSIIEN